MCHKSRSESGFTLIEATISMTLLLVVLVISTMFLMSMRTFSQRQEMFTIPRQTARRALEYLSYYVQGAADLNNVLNNPNAVVAWYQDNGGIAVQASYNNVSDANLADLGTDILTVAIPPKSSISAQYFYPGAASEGDVCFSEGCGAANDDIANMALFKQLTGCCDAKGNSPVLTIVGSDGSWSYFQITGYQGSNCAGSATSKCTGGFIHITANYGNGVGVNPPGGAAVPSGSSIKLGVFYNTFRVRNGQLQQKFDIFKPASDNPGTAFVPVLDNVEDFQVAWVFSDGSVWNDSAAHQLATTGKVPTQGGSLATDVTNVVALRLTIVARSNRLPVTILSRDKFIRPAAEDHAAGTADRFYHNRMTSTVMIRNRTLGS